MVYYIYDGSFEGLLTVVYETGYRRQMPDNVVSSSGFSGGLFVQGIEIITDPEKADKVLMAIKNKISSTALKNVYYAYLSEEDGIENSILRYLWLGWKLGKNVDGYIPNDDVVKVLNFSQKVGREKHRMLGLIRFRLTKGNVYYAPIETDHNIVALVAPHFVKRLADQNWVIHDVKRGIAALYNCKEWVLTDLGDKKHFDYHELESIYQSLWQNYFNSTAIKERINPKLQRSFMPVRYWRCLVEK